MYLRTIMIIGFALLVTGCGNQVNGPQSTLLLKNEAASNTNPANPLLQFGNLTAMSPPAKFEACITSNTLSNSNYPTLTQFVLKSGSGTRSSDQVELGPAILAAYIKQLRSASSDDKAVASNILTRHQSIDNTCFVDQIIYFSRQSPATNQLSETNKSETANTKANNYRRAQTTISQAYGTLAELIETKPFGEISELIARDFVPVAVFLPTTANNSTSASR